MILLYFCHFYLKTSLFVKYSFPYPLFRPDSSHLLTQVHPDSNMLQIEASKALLEYPNTNIQICAVLQLRTTCPHLQPEHKVKPCLAFSFGLNSSHTFLSGISDKTSVTMGNLQANLSFLHGLGDPWDLENPTKIAYRKHVRQCMKTIHNSF